MPKRQKNQRQKQQRALKKRSQRKQKLVRKQMQTAALQNPGRIVRQARRYPIEGCWVQRGWQEDGMAVVVVARSQPNDDVVFGTYMADYYCLGLKDTFFNANVPSDQFHDEFLPKIFVGQPPIDLPVALAHEIVYGSIEYAAQFDFRPHRDFARTQYVLDPPDEHRRSGGIEFGRDGKPLYIAGPHDNPRVIINRLMRTVGEGNFNVVLPGPEEDSLMSEEVEGEEPRSPLFVPNLGGEGDDDSRSSSGLWVPGGSDDDETADSRRSGLWTPGR